MSDSVLTKELINMIYSKTKKSIIAFGLVIIFFFGNALQLVAMDKELSNENRIEKKDSTKVKKPNNNINTESAKDEMRSKTTDTSNLSYNLIYYLISKFFKTNPLSKPR